MKMFFLSIKHFFLTTQIVGGSPALLVEKYIFATGHCGGTEIMSVEKNLNFTVHIAIIKLNKRVV